MFPLYLETLNRRYSRSARFPREPPAATLQTRKPEKTRQMRWGATRRGTLPEFCRGSELRITGTFPDSPDVQVEPSAHALRNSLRHDRREPFKLFT